MLIFHPKYRAYYSQVSALHKRKILWSILGANIFMLVIIGGLLLLMLQEKFNESRYIKEHTTEHSMIMSENNGLANKIAVQARVMLLSIGDINLKDKRLMLYLGVTLHYKPKQIEAANPSFEIVNAVVKEAKLVKQQLNPDGSKDVIYLTRVEIEPYYMMPLYPMDVQLISLRIAAAEMDSNYYIQVRDFQNYSPITSDYAVDKIGFVNQIENYPVNFAEKNTSYYNQFSRVFLIYDHQNILSYLKNIQYVLLSLSLAIFALLLNTRNRGPYFERFGLTSGAVFALGSNIFQINSSIPPVSSLTIIDLISVFTAVVIIASFFTTFRSIQFAEKEGYETAKAFDVAMFSVLVTYSVIFFVLVYCVL